MFMALASVVTKQALTKRVSFKVNDIVRPPRYGVGARSRAVLKQTMRQIVLDTETTSLDPLNGDRVVEIGVHQLGVALGDALQVLTSSTTPASGRT
jgi:DNA polymerase III epsilon subunit-like protein